MRYLTALLARYNKSSTALILRRKTTRARRLRCELLEPRNLMAVVAWDGGGGDNNWHTPANWSNDNVPVEDDDVEVSGSVAVSDSDVTVASLKIYAGELSGNASVSVAGLFTWSGGTLTGGGALNANGGMLIAGNSYFGGDPKFLNGRTLNNAGTAVWRDGYLTAYNGAVINNLPGATFDVQSDRDLNYAVFGQGGVGARATFHNAGTFRKTGNTPEVAIEILPGTALDVIFENTGTVEVQVGELNLFSMGENIGYVTTGNFVGAAGTSLGLSAGTLSSNSHIQSAGHVGLVGITLDGVYEVTGSTYLANTTVTGASVIVSMGNVTVEGMVDISSLTTSPVPMANLSLKGTLTGTSDVAVAGLFTWSGGTLTGSGALNANGGMLIAGNLYFGGDPKFLNGRTLNNAGTAVWRDGYLTAYNGAVINNLPGATFDVQSDRDLNYAVFGQGGVGARATFHNAGTFRKTGNTPEVAIEILPGTALDVIFENTGTVEVQVGELNLFSMGENIGYVTTGNFVGAAGTSLGLSAGTLSSNSHIQSAGHVGLVGITLDGVYEVTGSTYLANTTVTGASVIVSMGNVTVEGMVDISSLTTSPVPMANLSLKGTLTGTSDVAVAGLFTWSGGTLTGSGALNANGGMLIAGNLYFGGDPKFLNGRTLNNAGTAVWRDGYLTAYNGAVINNLPGATFDVQSDRDLNYAVFGQGGVGARATFHNAGTFRKTGNTPEVAIEILPGTALDVIFENTGTVEVQVGELNLVGSYTQTAGQSVLNGGTLGAGSPLQIQGGTVDGTGSIFADLSNGGQVSPGFSPGLIDLHGNYVQTSTGAFKAEIGGYTAGTQYDRLNVTGSVMLGGSLDLSVINGFAPVDGDLFTIIDNDVMDPVVGNFNGLPEDTIFTIPGGSQFKISYIGFGTSNDVVVKAINRPPVANAGGPYSIAEGSSLLLDGSGSYDPDPLDTLTYSWDVNGDGVFGDAGGVSPTLTWAQLQVLGINDGPMTVANVQVRVDDGHAHVVDSPVTMLTVSNVAPVMAGFISGPATAVPGQSVSYSVAFTDVGTLDSHTVSINWGDGNITSETVTETIGTGVGTAMGSHTYAGHGTYTITFTLSDDDLGVTTNSTSLAANQSIFVLHTTAAGAFTASGNGTVNVAGVVVVDSNSATAITASGNVRLTASEFNVVGGIKINGNAQVNGPVTNTFVPDPLAGMATPALGTVLAAVSVSGNTSRTINPGTYSSISVSGNGLLTMNPGIYVLAGGGFSVSGNGKVTGSGVSIVNRASAAGSTGAFSFGGNGAVTLTPTTSGPLTGILVFQPANNTKTMTISGNAAAGMNGSIYAPKAQMSITGNGYFTETIIVDRFTLSGNGSNLASVSQPQTPLSTSMVLPANIQLEVTSPYNRDTLPLPQDFVANNQARDQLFASLDDGPAKLLMRSQITSIKSQSDVPKKSASVSEGLLDEDLLETIAVANLTAR